MLAAAGSPRFVVPAPPPPQQPPPHGMVGVFEYDEQPVSRTYQYRKVMKPMLERKRRARINRCLDELKELMVSALAAEGENVAKLEKADILELTVRHLHRLRRRHRLAATPEASYADRFRAGFSHCAAEVSRFLAGNDPAAAARLLPHLGACLHACQATDSPSPSPAPASSPAPAPEDAAPPSPAESSDSNCDHQRSAESPPLSPVWRPW